jgi:hypothetical protein
MSSGTPFAETDLSYASGKLDFKNRVHDNLVGDLFFGQMITLSQFLKRDPYEYGDLVNLSNL